MNTNHTSTQTHTLCACSPHTRSYSHTHMNFTHPHWRKVHAHVDTYTHTAAGKIQSSSKWSREATTLGCASQSHPVVWCSVNLCMSASENSFPHSPWNKSVAWYLRKGHCGPCSHKSIHALDIFLSTCPGTAQDQSKATAQRPSAGESICVFFCTCSHLVLLQLISHLPPSWDNSSFWVCWPLSLPVVLCLVIQRVINKHRIYNHSMHD